MIETSSRLLELLSLLQARRDWRGPDLADRLAVSSRTLRRDVERLRQLGYPVESLTGPAGGYRLRAGTAMPPLLLDDDEAVAIAVGLRTAARASVTGIEETAVRALVKLEQVLPAHLRRRVGALGSAMLALPAGGPTIDPQHLTVIAAACRDAERLRFAYRSRDGADSRREVEPHTLVNLGRRWYLVAWDRRRENWRTFRVDRLERPASSGVGFTPRKLPAKDAAAYVEQSIAARPNRFEARITLHAGADEVTGRVPAYWGTVEPIDAHRCEYRTGDDDLGWLAVRIAMLGVDFEVHEPPELVEHLRTLAGRLSSGRRNRGPREGATRPPYSRGAMGTDPISVADYERLAAARLDPGVHGYFAGGAGAERTLRDNVAAFERWRLRPRTLVDVGEVSARTTVLGSEASMPALVAPVAFQRLAHPDGEPGMARAAAQAGTIMCLSTLASATPSEVAAAAPGASRWLQLYCFRDRGVTQALIDEAVDADFEAIALTVDAPYAGGRERDLRTGFEVPPEVSPAAVRAAVGSARPMSVADVFGLVDPALTWDDLAELASDCSLPVLVKGVLTGEDARLAVDHGAAGVVVSNHGGRQLDGVAASLDVLPEVVEAVDGGAEVLVDGGVRRGIDVLIALALGARAVLVGRAPLWGLAVGGADGAQRVLELLREEVELGLALLGCPTPSAVDREHLRPGA